MSGLLTIELARTISAERLRAAEHAHFVSAARRARKANRHHLKHHLQTVATNAAPSE